MTRELIPAFTARGSGHFVYISSISGKTATARASLYAATKFGLRGFALCLRDDLRPAGIGVSVVSPGAISGAGMFADSGAAAPPLIGTGKPEQVGAAVVSAIERNRGEVTVAPLRQRVLAQFAANVPELASRLAGEHRSQGRRRDRRRPDRQALNLVFGFLRNWSQLGSLPAELR